MRNNRYETRVCTRGGTVIRNGLRNNRYGAAMLRGNRCETRTYARSGTVIRNGLRGNRYGATVTERGGLARTNADFGERPPFNA